MTACNTLRFLCRGKDGYFIDILQIDSNTGTSKQRTVSYMNYLFISAIAL